MSPRLMFYVQSNLGIGHLLRSLRLATELAQSFDVALVFGGELPAGIPPPIGVRWFSLPAVMQGERGTLVSVAGAGPVSTIMRRRRELLLQIFTELAPEILITEYFPLGRLQFSPELLPLLAHCRSLPRPPLIVCSTRDIVERKQAGAATHADMASAVLNRFYDGVLVHSDASFIHLSETFGAYAATHVEVAHTGYIVASGPPSATPREPIVVVSAGGGRVGAQLLLCVREAYERHGFGAGIGLHVVAGPLLPEETWQALARSAESTPGLRLSRHVDDLRAEFATARASISQAGYNTTLELLAARTPALLVPHETPDDGEQAFRTARLVGLGAVRQMSAAELSPERIAQEVRATLEFVPAKLSLDLEGARGARLELERWHRRTSGHTLARAAEG
jgi:predicted glycosyltransferase